MSDTLPLFPTLLPSVPLSLRETLPAVCAVYFALTEAGHVLYIGGTMNLHRRWTQPHHRLQQLQESGCVSLTYYACHGALLDDIERAMIQRFTPPLNVPWRNTRKNPGTRIYKASSMRHSEEWLGLVDRLALHLGITKSALFEMTIREYAQKKGIT